MVDGSEVGPEMSISVGSVVGILVDSLVGTPLVALTKAEVGPGDSNGASLFCTSKMVFVSI
eukprot:CAMPEP_0168205660 /NCGR_PEP_ID=MMETSP0140_2-20121125/499_1 /TAXON_ID=44445 /ORGANISM="Pseudo-nitzschia australis, Strain 10249 10 AB" /LENGTH=60 /DNA_ID=CAMNT_0008131697 /DNA_START=268 /DNA_END=450 /DNA_ORIENTATION=-